MNWIWIILSNGKSHGKEQIMTPSSAKDSKENKGKDIYIFLKDNLFSFSLMKIYHWISIKHNPDQRLIQFTNLTKLPPLIRT